MWQDRAILGGTISTLLTRERDTYRAIWELPAYGEHSPGERYLPLFLDMAQPTMGGSVLDAGCGTGKGGLALQAHGFDVTLCDLTVDGLTDEARALPFREVCLWHNLKRTVGFYDYVYCADVLEHLPTQFTMLGAARLLEVARRGAFFAVALTQEGYGFWLGKPGLHQTVQPFVWWRDALAELGTLVEARDLDITGLYLLQP